MADEFRLPRLPKNVAITQDGAPNVTFQRWWQSVVDAIEKQEASQTQIISDLQAVQAEQAVIIQDIADIVTQLSVQLTAIQAAQNAADTVTLANDISASFIAPTSVLTATDAGSDATITVAGFTRSYDIAPDVVITGGNITGLAYSTTYAVYYDDATQLETDPAFVATATLKEGRHNFATGRHYIGEITTPASGGGGTSGGGYSPPGGGGGDILP